MIFIQDKKNCCGCSACVHACPKHCISLYEDKEGFLYPVVDKNYCVDCGVCEKVCHELNPFEGCNPLSVTAAINRDENVRKSSSSGGIFFALAEKIINENGIVFGARFDEHWQVIIDYAESIEGVKSFMGSKYVQARVENAYVDAKKNLKQGRKVLFSGTPCQIAGLHHYLHKQYDNLITVDFVCHGVPSPKVWKMYLNEIIGAGKQTGDVKFRGKNGWKQFNFVISSKDKNILLSSFHRENHYMRAFLDNLILRPSCYECRAKEGRSHSDITIADYWGIQKEHPEIDDDKGTGLVLINTMKGKRLFDLLNVHCVESTIEQAIRHNGGFKSGTSLHPKRERFFFELDGENSVISLIESVLSPNLRNRIKNKIRNLIRCYKNGGEISLNTPDISNARLVKINFRDKKEGWKLYRIEFQFENQYIDISEDVHKL